MWDLLDRVVARHMKAQSEIDDDQIARDIRQWADEQGEAAA